MTLSDNGIEQARQTEITRQPAHGRRATDKLAPYGAKPTLLGVIYHLAEGQPLRFKRQLAFCLVLMLALWTMALALSSSSVIGMIRRPSAPAGISKS